MSDYKIIDSLIKEIRKKRIASPNDSYIAKLFNKGRNKIIQKFGEESVELIIEATKGDKKKSVYEAADLLFHFLILLEESGIEVQEVLNELEQREGLSGLAEKANRGN